MSKSVKMKSKFGVSKRFPSENGGNRQQKNCRVATGNSMAPDAVRQGVFVQLLMSLEDSERALIQRFDDNLCRMCIGCGHSVTPDDMIDMDDWNRYEWIRSRPIAAARIWFGWAWPRWPPTSSGELRKTLPVFSKSQMLKRWLSIHGHGESHLECMALIHILRVIFCGVRRCFWKDPADGKAFYDPKCQECLAKQRPMLRPLLECCSATIETCWNVVGGIPWHHNFIEFHWFHHANLLSALGNTIGWLHPRLRASEFIPKAWSTTSLEMQFQWHRLGGRWGSSWSILKHPEATWSQL